MNNIKCGFACALVLLASACTRSIETKYVASMSVTESTSSLTNAKVGVARLADKRSWVDASDTKSRGFVAQQGSWKFGLTVDGKEYVPVDQLLRDAIGVELGRVGAKIVPIEAVLGTTDLPKYDVEGVNAKVDYVLGGDIAVFEFVNEAGIFTVTSRRGVTLNLKLKRVSNNVLLDKNYTENDRENEGLGVLHSTNVEKLVNGVLKKSIQQLVNDIAGVLRVPGNRVSLTLEIDGVNFALAQD